MRSITFSRVKVRGAEEPYRNNFVSDEAEAACFMDVSAAALLSKHDRESAYCSPSNKAKSFRLYVSSLYRIKMPLFVVHFYIYTSMIRSKKGHIYYQKFPLSLLVNDLAAWFGSSGGLLRGRFFFSFLFLKSLKRKRATRPIVICLIFFPPSKIFMAFLVRPLNPWRAISCHFA